MQCGRCKEPAATVATVRACYKGDAWPCDWHILDYNEDGEFARPCGAHATENPRGWACEAGHEHVTAEIRHREGWDHAHDEGEARLLRQYGVDAVAMNGGSI